MTNIPLPADRSANKPVYILIAKDLVDAKGFEYYLVESMVKDTASVEISKGYKISKAEYNKLIKKPEYEKNVSEAMNIIIPWTDIKRIINIKYNKKIGDKK